MSAMTEPILLAFLAYFPVMLLIVAIENRPLTRTEDLGGLGKAVVVVVMLGGASAAFGTLFTLVDLLAHMDLLPTADIEMLDISTWVLAFLAAIASIVVGLSRLIRALIGA